MIYEVEWYIDSKWGYALLKGKRANDLKRRAFKRAEKDNQKHARLYLYAGRDQMFITDNRYIYKKLGGHW